MPYFGHWGWRMAPSSGAAGRAGDAAVCQPELTRNLLRTPADIPLVDWDPELQRYH